MGSGDTRHAFLNPMPEDFLRRILDVLWRSVDDGNTLHPGHQGDGRVYGVMERDHWIISEALSISSGQRGGYPYIHYPKLAMWRLAIKRIAILLAIASQAPVVRVISHPYRIDAVPQEPESRRSCSRQQHRTPGSRPFRPSLDLVESLGVVPREAPSFKNAVLNF